MCFCTQQYLGLEAKGIFMFSFLKMGFPGGSALPVREQNSLLNKKQSLQKLVWVGNWRKEMDEEPERPGWRAGVLGAVGRGVHSRLPAWWPVLPRASLG